MAENSTLRLAWRGLGRNRKRSVLAIAAIGLGQFAFLATAGIMRGYADHYFDSVTGPLVGHVQIVAPGWREERAVDQTLNNVEAMLTAIRGQSQVARAVPRIYAPVLAALEEEGFVGIVVGADPALEGVANGLLGSEELAGLLGDGRVLVGKGLARQHGIEAGAELAVVGQDIDGSIASALYEVAAVVESPVELVNSTGIVAGLQDAQALLRMDDEAHEIAVRLHEAEQIDQAADSLHAQPALQGTEIKRWHEVIPQLAGIIKMMDVYSFVVLGIVCLASIAGIANTMMMSTFERRRELGMLLALGANPGRLFRMVATEAVLLGALGVLLGTALGACFAALTAGSGFDLAELGGEESFEMGFQGVQIASAGLSRGAGERRIGRRIGRVGDGPLGLRLAAAARGAFGAGGGDADVSGSLSVQYALRSLGRSRRRTGLSVLGVGLGCAIALFATAFMRGGQTMRVQAVSQSGYGHLRIAPAGWEQSRRDELRLQDSAVALEAARGLEGVAVVAPHVRVQGLLAFGTRVAGVQLLGVDPAAEPQLNRLVRTIDEGRYLQAGDEGAVVVGKALVERLDVELGDDLLLTLTRADGEMEYAMLRIVGIASTGSRTIDETICHAMLADVEQLTGLQGVAEVSVAFADPQQVDALSAELARRVQGDEVLTWREVLPAMGGDEAADRAFSSFFIVVVAAVVILGVTSAQLTAMLERRREFAVLMALGLGERKLVGLVLFEAVFMGALGALLGLLLALPLVWHTATAGIDFSAAMGDEMTVMGVFFDPIIYADMGLWMLPYAFGLGLCATLLAALYPAWSATRLDPAAALSQRDA